MSYCGSGNVHIATTHEPLQDDLIKRAPAAVECHVPPTHYRRLMATRQLDDHGSDAAVDAFNYCCNIIACGRLGSAAS
jgi:hypothetical protein